MRAVRLVEPGGPEALRVEEVEAPEPGEGEVLVQVYAAAITRDELEWPTDRLPAIPSYELSGLAGGEPVFALTPFDRDGAAAELVAVPAALLAPKPRSLTHVEAAAVPLAALSAWQALFDHGRLERGERVVISGAAGGVGHLAVQLALAHGAQVVGVASDPSAVKGGEAVDYESVRDAEPADLVFDTVGGEFLATSPALIRDGGRIVTVAAEPPEGVDAVYFVVEGNREQLVEIARLVDAGEVRPEIDSVFPLAEARAAFERLASPGKRGKVVLSVVTE